MEHKYLPGGTRERLQDLMKEHKVTQADLSQKIGCTEGTISRFISGKTDKIADRYVVEAAKLFDVSTDFLLGETDLPDRTHHAIRELGLTEQAGKNLYEERASAGVVSLLLEDPGFCDLTYEIEDYLRGSLQTGTAAASQFYSTVSDLLKKDPRLKNGGRLAAAETRNLMNEEELVVSRLEDRFRNVITEIRRTEEEKRGQLRQTRLMTAEVTRHMYSHMVKGEYRKVRGATPEEFARAVYEAVRGQDGFTEKAWKKLEPALIEFARDTIEHARKQANGQSGHGSH